MPFWYNGRIAKTLKYPHREEYCIVVENDTQEKLLRVY